MICNTSRQYRRLSPASFPAGNQPKRGGRDAGPFFGGKTMTIDPNRLQLVDRICAGASVEEKQSTLRDLVKRETGRGDPKALGLSPRPGKLRYLQVDCGKNLLVLFGQENDAPPPFPWNIVPVSHDLLEMPFLYGSYLELRKLAPAS